MARLATVRPDGAPHLVPVVFAAAGDTVWLAVDAEPKRTTQLQRVTNLRREPRCALHPGLTALVERHPQYRVQPPVGPLVVVRVDRWSGWSSA